MKMTMKKTYPQYTKRDVNRLIVESLFTSGGTINERQAVEQLMRSGTCSYWIIKRHKELTNNVH